MKRQLLFFALLLSGCSFFVSPPKRNEAAIISVFQLQKTTDSVYDEMIAGNKNYNASDYDIIQTQITNLALLESARNKTIASQVNILQTHFTFYRQQHESKGVLNNAELSTYKSDLDGFINPIYNSENSIK